MSKSSATLDSPETLLAAVEPAVARLQAKLAEYVAEEAALRAEIVAINEVVHRAHPNDAPPDIGRRDEATARLQTVDAQLYGLRAALDSLAPRTIAARAAVADGEIDVAALDAEATAALVELERVQAEQAEAMAAREVADESGTADELLEAERRLRRLARELMAAQAAALECQLACVAGARDRLGREAWTAERAVEAAAERVVAATSEHAAAVEATRDLARRRAYLNERASELQRQIAITT